MESKRGLHPTVYEFKQFMQAHPLLTKEVAENKKSLQDLFEEWTVLGPEHEQWQRYSRKEPATTNEATEIDPEAAEKQQEQSTQSGMETLGQLTSLFKRMSVQDIQNHLAQFNSVLANIQNVIQTFQRPSSEQTNTQQDHPFSFRRD
ncbi:hypothetical protein GN156_01660 [bacterium LRH843]|nr:hypothetical protein [bacterium LRH843]